MKRIRLISIALFLFLTTLAAFCSEQELFKEAESRYMAGNYALALETYEQFLNTYPLSDLVSDVQYRKAVCLYKLKRYYEALALFKEIEKRYRSTRFLNYVYYWAGLILYQIKDFTSSVDNLAIFLTKAQEEVYITRALVYKSLGEFFLNQYVSASITIKRVLRDYSESELYPYAVVLLSFIYLKQDLYPEVIELLNTSRPDDFTDDLRLKCLLYQAEALWHMERQDEAYSIYKTLINAPPEISLTALRRIFIYAQSLGDLYAMEQVILAAEKRFIDRKDLLADLWIQLGIESYKQQDYAQSKYFLQKAWEEDQERAGISVPLYLAEIQQKSGNLKEARDILQEALSDTEDEEGLLVMRMGDMYLLEDNYNKSIEFYLLFMKDHPDSPYYYEVNYFLALSYYKEEKYDKALNTLKKALEKLPPESENHKRHLSLFWRVYKKIGELNTSLEILKQYINTYPDDYRIRLEVLQLLFTMQQYSQVIGEAESLVLKYPLLNEEDPYAFILATYLKALSQISIKSYPAALTSFSQIERGKVNSAGLSSILPYILYYRGWANYKLGQYETAASIFKEFSIIYFQHELVFNALYMAGWCYYSLGSYSQAIPFLSELAEKEGADELSEKSLFILAKCYVNLGKNEEALESFSLLFTARADSVFADDALFEYASLLALEGDVEGAVNSLQKLLSTYTNSPLLETAYFQTGELYFQIQRYEAAREAFYYYRTLFPQENLVDASLYWGGMCSIQLNEEFNAIFLWEILIQKYLDSPYYLDAAQRTAELYVQKRNYDKALKLYSEILERFPDEANTLQIEKRISEVNYLVLGLSQQEAELNVTIEEEGGIKTKKGREAMIELARLYLYDQTKRELSFNLLLEVVAVKEDVETQSQAQYLLGEYYFLKNEYVLAGNEFLKAALINPKDRDLMAASIFRAAEMMKNAGKINELKELVSRLEQGFPASQWTIEAKKLLEGLE